jgi:hypothetical protein
VLKVSKPCAISHSFCLNEYNFSILGLPFRSFSISKQKLVIILCFDSISKQNVAFYSSLAMSANKTKQKRSKLPYTMGKNERNIRIFQKTNCFLSQKTKC